jgi:hypothetical protein
MGAWEDLPDGPWSIGWMFYGLGHYLSDRYRNETALVRPPITVICPCLHHWEDGSQPDRLDGTVFCIDSYPTPDNDQPADSSKHWDLTIDMDSLIVGQRPRITVSPSIHLIGIWHGWLQDGILHQ